MGSAGVGLRVGGGVWILIVLVAGVPALPFWLGVILMSHVPACFRRMVQVVARFLGFLLVVILQVPRVVRVALRVAVIV